jgi:hypothetical protein
VNARQCAVLVLAIGATVGFGAAKLARANSDSATGRTPHQVTNRGCPNDMVRTASVCIDRWEISTVDKKTGRALSPYYPPSAPLLRRVLDIWQIERLSYGDSAARALPLPQLPDWEIAGDFEPMAVSRANVVPQGYLSRDLARRVCENAGKRLCRLDEWKAACRGIKQHDFPYGSSYTPGACNVGRTIHSAFVLHGNSSMGHLDPRMNLVVERGIDPLLRTTGTTTTCASRWGDDAIFDMVGNLDEWVADDDEGFVGGFYARATTKGCDSRVKSHPPSYYDYSIGTRCCRSIESDGSE